MLTLNFPNKVTFAVNVQGTSANPTVRCIVGEHPGCVYACTKLSENKYEVIIDLPRTMREGAHDFKIEVLLNGRLFTPINTKINVVGGYENKISDERIAELEPASTHLPPVPEPPVQKKLPKEPLIKDFVKNEQFQRKVPREAKKPSMSALESIAKAPVQKRAAQDTVVIEQIASIPISLIKGEVIYK